MGDLNNIPLVEAVVADQGTNTSGPGFDLESVLATVIAPQSIPKMAEPRVEDALPSNLTYKDQGRDMESALRQPRQEEACRQRVQSYDVSSRRQPSHTCSPDEPNAGRQPPSWRRRPVKLALVATVLGVVLVIGGVVVGMSVARNDRNGTIESPAFDGFARAFLLLHNFTKILSDGQKIVFQSTIGACHRRRDVSYAGVDVGSNSICFTHNPFDAYSSENALFPITNIF